MESGKVLRTSTFNHAARMREARDEALRLLQTPAVTCICALFRLSRDPGIEGWFGFRLVTMVGTWDPAVEPLALDRLIHRYGVTVAPR